MGSLWQDLRYSVRTLLRSPVFSSVAILTVGLGVGANTAIFSVVYGVMLTPLPYHDPDRLVRAYTRFESLGFDRFWLSWGEYAILRERNDAFSELGAYGHTGSWNLSGDGTSEQIQGAAISASLLTTLGVDPIVGRNFSTEEDLPNGEAVVLIGYGLWQRLQGGADDVIGRTLELNGRTRRIVGVLPPNFRLPTEFRSDAPSEAWIPLALDPTDRQSLGGHNYNVVGRLARDATMDRADANVKSMATFVRENFNFPEGFSGLALPLTGEVVGDVRLALMVLLGAVGFVLLIACANVANLMLARAESRQREMALRVALGAGRGRLLKQLLTESVLLSLVGGVLAVGLAAWGVHALLAVDPTSIPRANAVGLSMPVLGFTVVLSLLTGLLFGVIPALHATSPNLQMTLREGDRGTTVGSGRHRVRRALAISEVALALLLAVGAGLLIKSFWRLRGVDPGLDPHNVLTMNTFLPSATYGDSTAVSQFYQRVLDETRTLPGVEAVGLTTRLPVDGAIFDWSFQIEGQPVAPGEAGPNADYYVVSEDYFRAMGIPVQRGATFTTFPGAQTLPTVVINETMAARFWPGEDPIGKRISLLGPPSWHQIIGIVRDVKSRGLTAETRPEMYLEQRNFRSLGPNFRDLNLVVRNTADPLAIAGAVRGIFRTLDPAIPIARLQTVEQIVSNSLSAQRFSMMLLSIFAAVALALAAVGIYGVMSYTVAQRAHEIGIRLALGADRSAVRRLIVKQGMGLAVVGLGLGAVLAIAFTRVIDTMLFGVSAVDPVTFVGVAGLMGMVAFAANYIPALRASRGDPIVALRTEQ
jgi:putative ABC transport system permease protein